MKRLLFVLVILAAVLAVAPLQASAQGRPPGVTLSPSSLDFGTTTVGNILYRDVTVNTRGPVVLYTTVTTYPPFLDTQSGTCWQDYEALALEIPPHTSCTIELSFKPTTTGTFTGTLSVSRCLSWYLDPTYGFIVCDVAGASSETVSLTGTGN